MAPRIDDMFNKETVSILHIKEFVDNYVHKQKSKASKPPTSYSGHIPNTKNNKTNKHYKKCYKMTYKIVCHMIIYL